ncbi:MAG: 50S ribosomal protein L11 methyltransferase [Candidatus Thorarchaeota archaeon]
MMSGKEYATPFPMLRAVSLLSHRTRIQKFQQAIIKTVRSNHHVIDLGTGSGILALLAAQQGARVTALDANSESLRYAKEAAEKNKLADKIEFVHSHFQEYKPEEKADVVICEMLSSLMLIEQQIPASRYSVEYLLKPSGRLIPEQVALFVVPVQNEILWNRFEVEGLIFPRIPQTAEKGQSTDLAELTELARFNLLESSANKDCIDERLEFKILQEGSVHGLVGMFESKLCDGITLSMNDGWRELFIPLTEPIEVSLGERLNIRIRFNPGQYDSLTIERN